MTNSSFPFSVWNSEWKCVNRRFVSLDSFQGIRLMLFRLDMPLPVWHSPHIEEYLRSNMVACKNILKYEAEVQNTLSYINFNSSTMEKAKKKCKKKCFFPFYKHLNPKKGPFWAFFLSNMQNEIFVSSTEGIIF